MAEKEDLLRWFGYLINGLGGNISSEIAMLARQDGWAEELIEHWNLTQQDAVDFQIIDPKKYCKICKVGLAKDSVCCEE